MAEPTADTTRTWRSRNVLSLGLVSFFTDIHSETILALLPQFMAHTLGLSKDMIGLIEGVAEAMASLLKVVSGWYSDKIGKRKPIVLGGYALSTAVKPLLALAQSGSHVLGVRIADRIGKGVRTSARDALLADSVAPEHRGRAYGFHRGMDTGGAIVGTILAIVLLQAFAGDYRRVFLASTIAGVLAVVTIFVGVHDPKKKAEDTAKPKKEVAEQQGSLPLFLVAHTIFSAGNFSYAFFLLRAEDVGVSAGLVPAMYLVHNVVYAAVAFPAGLLLDRFGARKAQTVAYLTHTVACLGFAHFGQPVLMPLLFAIYGIQLGATGACTKATAAGLIKASKRGLGMGVFHACEGMGLLIASVAGGQLWQRLGSASAPFYYGAVMAVLATILVYNALKPNAADTGLSEG